MSETRTITLTGRPPVRIFEANWPVIASAGDNDYDGQVECQSFHVSKWSVIVRRHADGRAIVYAIYRYETRWQGERSRFARRGVMLPATTDDAICDAIRDVCSDIASADHYGDDASRWDSLAADCIADMPAEVI